MPRTALLGFFHALGCLALATAACGQPTGSLFEIAARQEQAAPASDPARPTVDLPYFDRQGRLLWDAHLIDVPGAEVCSTAPFGGAKTWLREPRVDEVRCGAPGGTTTNFLVGLDPAGKVAWRTPLGFRSGGYTLDQLVLGATPEGVVLSDLTVVAPATGAIVVRPKTHLVGSERRPVPDLALVGAAIYLPRERAFLHFDAQVDFRKSEGGLYRIDERSANRELLVPVATTLLRGSWRVESIALSSDERIAYLGERLAFRGEGGVAFSVLDLGTRRIVFRRTFDEDRFCSEPSLVLGPSGRIGFSYRDDSKGQRKLIELHPRS